MKVIDLRCHNGHGFEGWFASDDDFLAQNGRQLIACPLCADSVIVRLPSAPRLNLSGAREAQPQAEPSDAAATLQSKWLEMVRHVAEEVFIPFTVGGGIRSVDDARRMLRAGADKVGVNTAAVERPELIAEIAAEFGNQCVVVAVDSRASGATQNGPGRSPPGDR